MKTRSRHGGVTFLLACGALCLGGCSSSSDDGTTDVPDVPEARDGDVPRDDGGEVAACDPGLTACGGFCVDLQDDPANCGACGTTCPLDRPCDRGACSDACTGGRTNCGGSCVDLTTDAEHCSACDHACEAAVAADPTCVAGACDLVCHEGFVDLDGLPGCEVECTATGSE